MKKEILNRSEYTKPGIETLEASQILESMGPVSAGSGVADPNTDEACGPMLENFCL